MVVSRLSKACGALTLAALLAVGCGDSGSDSSGTTGDGSTPTGDASTPTGGSDASTPTGGSDASTGTGTGNVATGKTKSQLCAACHGTDMSGNTAIGASNITPDIATGIGAWTTQQIVDALLKNIDDEGAALCAQMAATKSLSQTDALDLAAYLKSIPAVSKDIPDTCK
jgi:cytochrome c553